MKQEKTQLGIILAIEEASTEQLKALARIESAITSVTSAGEAISAPQSTVAPMQEVTVKATRRTRNKPVSAPADSNKADDDLAKKIAGQIAKIHAPFQKRNAQRQQRERDSKGRFISADALRNLSEVKVGNATVASNERINAAESDSGVSRQKAVSEGVADLPLIKNIKSLNDTIAEQTAEVVRIDKNGRKRDSNGRFLSKEKADELKAKQSGEKKSAEGKLQDGFLKRLGSALTEHGRGAVDVNGGDIVGAAAGGALWQMGRGAWDIASTAKDNAVSVNEWRKKHFTRDPDSPSSDTRGHAETLSNQTAGNLALKPAVVYPPVTARPVTPSDGADASKEIFEDNAKQAQVKATEKQTATLSSKDDVIIKNQEEELDLLKKIAHNSAANDGIGKGLFKRLFGGLLDRDGRTRRRKSRRSRKANRIERIKDTFRRKKPDTESDSIEKSRKTETHGKTKKERATRTREGKSTIDKSKPTTIEGKSTPDVESSSPNKTSSRTIETVKTDTPIKTSDAEKVTKPAVKDGGKIIVQSEKSAMAAGGVRIGDGANDALGAGEKIGAKTLATEAVKTGGKVALKAGLKMIPVIGTAAGVAWDAADGYNDTEGQKKAFNLKDGEEATTREKSEMSAANIAGLGGLVPLASQGASWLANKAGLTDKTDALDVDTSDIAKGIHKGVGAVGSAAVGAYSLAKGLFSTSSDDKSAQDAQSQQVADLTKAVTTGSQDTVNAIDRLSKQLEGGKFGEDGVGAQGTQTADYQAPTTSTVLSGPNGLNIGGTHAANRNFRNNNFGNLNFAGQEGAVLEDTPGKGKARFARFATPEDGFRALANQVSSYANGTSKAAVYQKLNTVSEIISKWAPPNENNTEKYIQTISTSLGVKPTDKINTADPQVMTKLIRAIATYEGGNPTVSDGYIQNSIGSEDATTHKWTGGSYSKESQEYMAKKGINPAKGMQPVSNATVTNAAKTAETIKSASLADVANSPTQAVKEAAKPGLEKPVTTAHEKVKHEATQAVTGVSSVASKPSATPDHVHGHVEKPQEIRQTAANPKVAEVTQPAATGESEAKTMAEQAAGIGSVISEVASTNWLDKGADFAKKTDNFLTEKLEKVSGQHVGFRRATSDLTLPKNSGPVPESVKEAMASPEQIAKAQAPDLSVNQYGQQTEAAQTPGAQATTVSQLPEGDVVPANMVGRAFEVDSKTGKSQSPAGEAQQTYLPSNDVIPADMVNRAYPVAPNQPKTGFGTAINQQQSADTNQGFLGSIGGFISDMGHSAMKAVPGALSAVGSIAMPAAQGLLGNIVGDLGSQVSNTIGSPILNSIASPFIDKGVSTANSFIQSPQQAVSSFSMPQVLPAVTDLAKSGASNAMQQITAQMPPEIAKALQQLVELGKQQLNVQKENGDSKPDVVTHGGQKPTKHDDIFSDSALEALLEDR
ncbi:hypothetical protein [Rosenbergiella epipactidis]|uniref:hypothetical protein n=1 Tax=Rosenbergiella epipactidis TaxID=1544694 RepID=UPI001F4E7522|nr:hypothetical protein [Rosenbergiella epipactidis]